MRKTLLLAAVLCLAALAGGSAARAEELELESLKAQLSEFTLDQDVQQQLGQIRYQTESWKDVQEWWRRHTQGAPYTGRHRIIFVPAEWANKLGEYIYQGMLLKYKKDGLLDNDPEAVAQIKRVCDRLIAVAEQPQLKWEYHLIDTGTVNAFAVAGGKIGVLKGILKYTKDDLGLAVVLSHEVSHVVERHLDERLSEMIVLQVAKIAGSVALPHVLPILLPAQLAQIANMAATIAQIYDLASYEGTRLGMAGFSRTAEFEADRVGLIMMAKAGYDPLLAVEFWKRMLSGHPDPKHANLVKWWRSHPLTSERIAALEKWAPIIRDEYYKP